MIFGVGRPSAIEEAYGGRMDAPDWRWQVEQLTEATLDRGVLTWIPDLIGPRSDAVSGTDGPPAEIAGTSAIEATVQGKGSAG